MKNINIKLSFGEPKFFINEKKQVVTCMLNYQLNASDYASLSILRYLVRKYACTFDSYGESYVTAQAKLDPLDTFDEEIGKKVARAKAESKAYGVVEKALRTAFERFEDEFANAIDEFSDKSTDTIAHNNRYIKQF